MITLFKNEVPEIVKTDIPNIFTIGSSPKIFIIGIKFFVLFAFLACSLNMPKVWASSGNTDIDPPSGYDVERPKPVFTRTGDAIAAKYIPLAKSNSVILDFKVSKGGKLLDVKGMEFEKAARPEVDIKCYKSSLFVIEIEGVSPAGSDAIVNISSDFFTSGTEYHVFNEKLPQAWFNSECHNVAMQGRVREIMLTVKDGGPFDSDGAANGRITFVGAPYDSFWGYALGTLVIRFFGVFLVLSVLLIGMMLSGAFFNRMDAKKAEKESDATDKGGSDDIESDIADEPESEEDQFLQAEPDLEEPEDIVDDYEIAAAIGTALALYFQSEEVAESSSDNTESADTTMREAAAPASEKIQRTGGSHQADHTDNTTWANDGRSQMMRERQQTYNRGNR